MALILLLLNYLLVIGINYVEVFSHEVARTSKTSLDTVTLLTADNFTEEIYNSRRAWLVQFYNSQNNRGITSSSEWNQLAASIDNWRSIIEIGITDCSDDLNLPLCRAYDVINYPTMRFFPPLLQTPNIGESILFRNLSDLAQSRTQIIEQLMNCKTKISNWPDLSPTNSDTVESIFWKANNSSCLILVVEAEDSKIGRELMLDLYHVNNVRVRFTSNLKFSNSKENLPQVFVVRPDYTLKQLPLVDATRSDVFKTVGSYLENKGYVVSDAAESRSDFSADRVRRKKNCGIVCLFRPR